MKILMICKKVKQWISTLEGTSFCKLIRTVYNMRTGEISHFWHVQDESGFPSLNDCSQTINHRAQKWVPVPDETMNILSTDALWFATG